MDKLNIHKKKQNYIGDIKYMNQKNKFINYMKKLKKKKIKDYLHNKLKIKLKYVYNIINRLKNYKEKLHKWTIY